MPDVDAFTYECAVLQSHNGAVLANVIHVRDLSSSLTEGDIAGFIADAWTATNSLADCQVQDVLYTSVNVRNLGLGTPTVVTPWPASQTAGSVVGDPVDPGSCLGFTFRTGVGGRSGRGRMYLGGVGRGALDAFSTAWDLGTSPGSTFKFAAQVFASELVGNAIQHVILSKIHNKAPRPVPQWYGVIDWVARTSILSQDPRARRYGVV